MLQASAVMLRRTGDTLFCHAPTLAQALRWAEQLHSHLSNPAGGGVRHGLDLKDGVQIDPNAARLFCNLIKSYIGYLLVEHERLAQAPARVRRRT